MSLICVNLLIHFLIILRSENKGYKCNYIKELHQINLKFESLIDKI